MGFCFLLTVQFIEHISGKESSVSGFFPFTDPWWSVTVRINRQRHSVGSPSYKLRTDDAVAFQGIVLLFMKYCQVEPQHIELFHAALR